MRTIHLAALAAALAAGCQAQTPPAPTAPPQAGRECNAQPAQFAVGQAYGEALADEVRRRSGASDLRVLRPGMAATMEFNPQRVNLDLDAGNRVTRVRCG